MSAIETVKNASLSADLTRQHYLIFAASVFLVSVPVFFQAPLVRSLPWVSLVATVGWLAAGYWLKSRHWSSGLWGDLLIGFSWTWLAGTLYWGWLRWEPLWHLPVEAIGLPVVLFFVAKKTMPIGNWFYLGSLFGTAMTDFYFHSVGLIPHWRQLMTVEFSEAQPILQSALELIHTSWGIGCAGMVLSVLIVAGYLPLRSTQLHWWAFSGSVLSTILVDGLFWLAATTV